MLKSIKLKLLLLSLSPMILILSIAMTIIIYLQNQSLKNNVNDYRTAVIEERQKELKDAVLITKHVIDNMIAKGNNEQDTIKEIEALLNPLRFADNNAGYFFIYTIEGINVVHPLNSAIQGTNQIAAIDANGIRYIQALIQSSKGHNQFVEYSFPKNEGQQPQLKKSYAATVNNGKWILGTGLYLDDIEANVLKYNNKLIQSRNNQIQTVIILSIIFSLLSIIVIVLVASRITKPITRMAKALDDIADGEGDLTKRLDVAGNDELAQLANAFNRFASKLQNIMTKVSQSTAGLTTAAQHVHQQTNMLTTTLDSHNCETEQIVTAVQQMSLAANEIAESTNDVASSTTKVSDDALLAQQQVDTSLVSINTLVDEVTHASGYIDDLNQQSHSINNVLKVIGDIADQTNLLALNAAIEAARAGEQGRGFAVVADEVRELASRTQSSTLEINEMLDKLHYLVTQAVNAMEKSQASCNEAVNSTNQISYSLQSVTKAVNAIDDRTNQIATASTEQNAVTGEINSNMISIQDIVTKLIQENHNSEKIITQLDQATHGLKQLVGQFKIK
ncbi:chemotaxis protein [Photobacterium kishitanii]|nr:chemotaxis protein [Photobacterium kishitanii]